MNLKSVDTVHTVIQIPQASVTITEDTDDSKFFTQHCIMMNKNYSMLL